MERVLCTATHHRYHTIATETYDKLFILSNTTDFMHLTDCNGIRVSSGHKEEKKV